MMTLTVHNNTHWEERRQSCNFGKAKAKVTMQREGKKID